MVWLVFAQTPNAIQTNLWKVKSSGRAMIIDNEVQRTWVGETILSGASCSAETVWSDAEVARSVEIVLQWLTSSSTGDVQVTVERGIVTLAGSLDWRYHKSVATSHIRRMRGVVAISDNIKIRP